MTAGRTLWAGLRLLDRQLVDRNGRMTGMVDDLELSPSEDGQHLYVTAILSGPGALAQRLDRRRYGNWMRGAQAVLTPGEGDPAHIPMNKVSEIGDHITVAADAEELGSFSNERWVRDHIIDHIPGSRHAPE